MSHRRNARPSRAGRKAAPADAALPAPFVARAMLSGALPVRLGGLPAKLHAPGKPWHGAKVTILAAASWPEPPGSWRVNVRRWPWRAIYWRGVATTLPCQCTVPASQLRLLPTKRVAW